MRCEWTLEDLSAYMDGELGAAQAQRLREHLATCSECRRQAGALRQTASLAKVVAEVEPPADLRARAARLMAAAPREATCEQALVWASQQMDGELPTELVVALERHLEACPSCRPEARALEQTAALMKALPEMNPPLRVRAAVHNGLARRERAVRARHTGWAAGWLTMAAAAAAFLFLAVRTHNGNVPVIAAAPGTTAAVAALAQTPGQPPAVIAAAPAETPGVVAAAAPASREGTARRIVRVVANALSPSPVRRAGVGVSEASMASTDLLGRVAAAGASMVVAAGPRDTVEDKSVASEGGDGNRADKGAAALEVPAVAAEVTSESTRAEPSIVEAVLDDVRRSLSARPLPLQPIKAERKKDKRVPDSF